MKRILSILAIMCTVIGVMPAQVVKAEENNNVIIEELEVTRKIHEDFEITPELLEWGKYPGLNVDILHKYGFTGKGVTIAYVDQPFDEHEELEDIDVHYTNNSEGTDSMHGPAVLSLLAGKDIGVTPDIEVYYYAHSCWKRDQRTHAECLYQIIEQNKLLPDDEKITMVGFSDIIDETEGYSEEFRKAVSACEENGIMVWFADEFMMSFFIPFSNKNDVENLVINYEQEDLIYVPTSRTTADKEGYSYWTTGGTSWAISYAIGLYGMAKDINPTLDEDGLRNLMCESAYDRDGLKIINPVGFISAVLKTVGRNAEADAMLQEVAARNQYVYAVINMDNFSSADLKLLSDYLTEVPYTVLTIDSSDVKNYGTILETIIADSQDRDGDMVGLYFYNNAKDIPSMTGLYSKFCDSYAFLYHNDDIHVTKTRGFATSTKMLLDKTIEGTLPENCMIYCSNYQKLGNDYFRFTVEYKALPDVLMSLVYTTEDNVEHEVMLDEPVNDKRNVLRIDIAQEDWDTIKTIGVRFQTPETNYSVRYNK